MSWFSAGFVSILIQVLFLGKKTLLKAVNKELQSLSKFGIKACVIAISAQVNITVRFRGGALLRAKFSIFMRFPTGQVFHFYAVFRKILDKL